MTAGSSRAETITMGSCGCRARRCTSALKPCAPGMLRSSRSRSASGSASTSWYSASTFSASRSCACGSTRATAPRRASRKSGWSSAISRVGIASPALPLAGEGRGGGALRHAAMLYQRFDYRWIRERARVAELVRCVLRDLAQDAAHDLSAARLRQPRCPLQVVGRGDRADFLAHVGDEFLAQLVGIGFARDEGDVGVDALAL